MTELEEFRKQKDVLLPQAAVFFAQTAKRVQILVRTAGLAETMLRYLTRRIEENPRIVLRTKTEIVAVEGAEDVERVRRRRDDPA
jgi:thioredoxin reductase (NADPH)